MKILIRLLITSMFLLPAISQAENIEDIVANMDAVTSSFEDYRGTGALSPRADGEEIGIGVYVVRSETNHRFKTVVRELGGEHTTVLTYIGKDGDQQWLYTDSMPGVMRLQVQGNYLGSEFSYEDIASLWEIRRFEYTEKMSGPCKGCTTLTRTPRFTSQYGHQKVVIDEQYRIRSIRCYEEGIAGPFKKIMMGEYKPYGNIFLPHSIHVNNASHKSYIHLDEYELDIGMNERDFQSRNIGNRKWPY